MKRWSMSLGGVVVMALVLVFLCSVSFASGGPRAPDTMIQQSIDDVDVTFDYQLDDVEPSGQIIACNQCRFVPVEAPAATASPAEVGVRVGIKSRASPEKIDAAFVDETGRAEVVQTSTYTERGGCAPRAFT